MGVKSVLLNLLPFAAMVMVECLDVGLTTLSKAAMSKGMSQFVFVVYSNALATLILLPSLIFYRTKRPPVTFSLLCKFFLLSLVGITLMQNCVFTGVSYSSPTLASAMGQLIPAFTFLLAVIFRMEKLDWRSSRSRIKIMGTLVSVSGALTITLYKGPAIGAITTQSNPEPIPSIMSTTNSWIIGGLFLVTADLCVSIFTTLQAAILKEYPSEIAMVSFLCLFGTIQSSIVSLIAERNPNAWKLRPDIELISIIYSAVVGSVVTFGVTAWCLHKKGPVFVAIFKPVGIATAAFLGVIFLGDTLHAGSIVGAIIIVAGFYGVIWAQSKEDEHSKVNRRRNGTVRGKKDAATALFNLSLNQTNKSRAIKAGIIPALLCLLEENNLGMIDEALSILLLLASHPEGRNEIGRLSFIETLVGIIRNGTPKNKECAASVLLELGLNNSSIILAALQYGVYEHLAELTKNGTNRAQRKANSLLQHMCKYEHLP